jgi:hypothetical protein
MEINVKNNIKSLFLDFDYFNGRGLYSRKY